MSGNPIVLFLLPPFLLATGALVTVYGAGLNGVLGGLVLLTFIVAALGCAYLAAHSVRK